MKRTTELQARAYFVAMIFTILALVIVYRVIKISVFEGDKWRGKGSVNVQWKEVDADRGNIYSDDESLLATSLQFFEIRMDMTVADDKTFNSQVDSLAYQLSQTVRKDKTYNEWRKSLLLQRKKGNKYYLIARKLDVEELAVVKQMPILRRGRYGGGIRVIRHGKRTKPFRQLASRTIGLDRENSQKVGLEGYFDRFLKGPVDKRLMKKVSATSDIWIPVYDPSQFEVRRGHDIKTTINIHLQDVMHSELEAAMNKYEAKSALGAIVEVKTGEIKAISNLENQDGVGMEVRNKMVGNAMEPGSTFKLASTLAMIDDGYADLDTKVDLGGGQAVFWDRRMVDSHLHGRRETTLKEVFAISSNVGVAKLANKFYNQNGKGQAQFYKKLVSFGLKDKLGVEIEGEAIPNIKSPIGNDSTWYGTTIPWMAHGYELAITPLQMLNLYAAVANGGKMMKLHLVSEIRDENGRVKTFDPKVRRKQIAKPESIAKVQELLEEVVENGTARNIKSKRVKIAGKTGTTRLNYAKKDEVRKYNASFAGYFPADNPTYAMIIVLVEPKGSYYGSSVAAPVFMKVAEKTMAWRHEMAPAINATAGGERMLPPENAGYVDDFKTLFEYVGLDYKEKTQSEWVNVDPFETKMLIEKRNIQVKEVPDVRGMGARDALYVLENLGMQVSLEGKGRVTKQTIRPGTKLTGQKIEIYLD